MRMKMMIKCIFVLKTRILCFYFYFSFFHSSYFVLLSYLGKFLVFSIHGVYNCQDCKQYVGAGINILIYISDGLGPSIFCRKMEKARPLREEMDGTVV